jgi:RNA recognition motif-containing protein
VDVSLPRDRATGKVRGFGFVTFSTAEEANSARDSLDGSMQAGRSISVRPFSSEPPRRTGTDGRGPESFAPGATSAGGGGGFTGGGTGGGGEDRTLYVGNLPYDTTQQELTQVFTELGVGPVARIHLPTGPDGRLRGFGFVTLGSAEAANSAIVSLRNADVRGRRLMVNIAHPRGTGPAAGAGFSDRPSYGPRPNEPRFPTEPPMNFEGARPAAPADRRGRPGGETDWAEEAKKKKKRGKGTGGAAASRTDDARKRGGGSNWQTWSDPDDDE